ncbi:Protein CCC1 [Nakaseomyces bracarensis]|uniref:Protein CCC1 n=1 Tax=Nakaseomyces bracarensis TaxID=273131 RepID=A0ABR4NTP4_9SACH
MREGGGGSSRKQYKNSEYLSYKVLLTLKFGEEREELIVLTKNKRYNNRKGKERKREITSKAKINQKIIKEMSIVGLKNAIVSAVSGGNSSKSLVSSGSNSYGSTDAGDRNVEAGQGQGHGHGQGQGDEGGKVVYNEDESSGDESTGIAGLFNSVDPRVISDLIIGLSDGLTVPFALTAGLSSLGDSKLVITGGFAELISGAISMGLGGYLGAKSESDYYHAEVKNEKRKFYDNMTLINHEIEDILLDINPDFSDETIVSFFKDLQRKPELMVDFIIRYGRGLDEPAENRQTVSALTIGGGYLGGGLVPLIPYFFVDSVGTGLIFSIIVMVITLFWFGYIKTMVSMGDSCTTSKKVSEGLQMVVVGGVAAGAAWFFVKLLG